MFNDGWCSLFIKSNDDGIVWSWSSLVEPNPSWLDWYLLFGSKYYVEFVTCRLKVTKYIYLTSVLINLIKIFTRKKVGQRIGHEKEQTWISQPGECVPFSSVIQQKNLTSVVMVECDEPESECYFKCLNHNKPKVRRSRCLCKENDINNCVLSIQNSA